MRGTLESHQVDLSFQYPPDSQLNTMDIPGILQHTCSFCKKLVIDLRAENTDSFCRVDGKQSSRILYNFKISRRQAEDACTSGCPLMIRVIKDPSLVTEGAGTSLHINIRQDHNENPLHYMNFCFLPDAATKDKRYLEPFKLSANHRIFTTDSKSS